jgi:hypothetical protein
VPPASPIRAGYHFVRGHSPFRTPGEFIVIVFADIVSPTYDSGEEGDQSNAIVAVTFSEAIQSADFTVGVTIRIDGIAATITSAVQQADPVLVFYTLASPWAASNSVVTFTYSDITGDYRDLANNQMGDITTEAVVNDVGRHERYDDAPNSFHLAYL